MQFWELFQWWNLIFSLPFAIGLMPFLLQAAGALRVGHGAHHVPIGHTHWPHVPHPGHTPVAAHGQAPLPTPGGHGQASTSPTPRSQTAETSRLLSILGIGKVPIMLGLPIFCLVWGITGVAANQVFSHILRAPVAYVWPSVLFACLAACLTTSALSQRISRLIPELESYGTDEELLVGRIARAAYELDATPGSAFLLDDRQNRVQVRCRSHNGSSIPGGAEVLLLEYDPKTRVFTVAPLQREQLRASDPPSFEHRVDREQKWKLR